MADFLQRTQRVMRKVKEQHKGANVNIVDLVSDITQRGSKAQAELDDLQALAVDLSAMQHEFVSTHDNSCNNSIERFVHIRSGLQQTDERISRLKSQIVRLCNAQGSHSRDLLSLYKKKQRNKYLHQILSVMKDISTLESDKEKLLADNQYLQCAHLLQRFQVLSEQWPVARGDRSSWELAPLYTQLLALLSSERVGKLVNQVKEALVNNIMRLERLQKAESFAGVMEGDDPTNWTDRHGGAKLRKLSVRTNFHAGLEQLPFHEGVRPWFDDAPIVTSVPQCLLNGVLLRGSSCMPAKVNVSVASSVRATLFVAFRPGVRDGGLKMAALPAWNLCRSVELTTVGDHNDFDSAQVGWVFYEMPVEAQATANFPQTAEEACILMIIVPQAEDESSTKRAECVSALHVLGSVCQSKRDDTSRLLEVMQSILQPTLLSTQYMDTFALSFCNWRKQNIAKRQDESSTALLTGLRDLQRVRAATSDPSLGTLSSAYDYERRIAELQAPLLQQLMEALFGELSKILRNYADVARMVKDRCFPAVIPGPDIAPSRVLLHEDELSMVARELVSIIDNAPKQDSDSEPAMEVARLATKLMASDTGACSLKKLVGPRRAEGWLGMPPPKQQTYTIRREALDEEIGLELDETLAVTGCKPETIAGLAGLKRLVGYRVYSVATPADSGQGQEARGVPVVCRTLSEYEAAASSLLVLEVVFKKRLLPPATSIVNVQNQILHACQTAGQTLGLAEQFTGMAEEALTERGIETIRELVIRLESKHSLGLGGVGEMMQNIVSPLLKDLCSPHKGSQNAERWARRRLSGGPSAPSSPLPGRKELVLLDRLLEGRYGPEKLPKLLEGAPPVLFSFPEVAFGGPAAAAAAPYQPQITDHITPTPFNALVLYRLCFKFEDQARDVVGKDAKNTLTTFIEDQVNTALLPKMAMHFREGMVAAFSGAHNPVHFDAVEGESAPPVSEGIYLAAQAMQSYFEIPDSLPRCAGKVKEEVVALVELVIDSGLEQLKKKTAGLWPATIVAPMIEDILRTGCDPVADGQPEFQKVKEESLAVWRTFSATGDERISIQVGLLAHQQGKQRPLTYIKSSQDLAYICCLAHSLEWLADQLLLHGGDRSEMCKSVNIFRARTACFETAIPGVEDSDDPADDDPEGLEEDLNKMPRPGSLASVQLERLFNKLIVLSRGTFFILQVDLYCRSGSLLDSKDTYDRQYDTSEPNEFVETFNRDLRRVHVTYSQYLPPVKHRHLMRALPVIVSFDLIRAITNLKKKYVTKCGVARLQRNLFALQQNLALLVADGAESDDYFVRVRRYYELFSCQPHELAGNRIELAEVGIEYDDEEFEAVQEVVTTAYASCPSTV
ncbi:Exocyst complex component 4 [Diplonema papillatum]|nr:Exocyst complex component 4 [Diplonema papillatum]